MYRLLGYIFGYGLTIFLVITIKLWLFGSALVSSVKAISNNCGHQYPLEVYVINGDWFCPSKEK